MLPLDEHWSISRNVDATAIRSIGYRLRTWPWQDACTSSGARKREERKNDILFLKFKFLLLFFFPGTDECNETNSREHLCIGWNLVYAHIFAHLLTQNWQIALSGARYAVKEIINSNVWPCYVSSGNSAKFTFVEYSEPSGAAGEPRDHVCSERRANKCYSVNNNNTSSSEIYQCSLHLVIHHRDILFNYAQKIQSTYQGASVASKYVYTDFIGIS